MNRRFHTVVLYVALAIAYFCAGKFGLSLAVVNSSASPVWVPTGLALAVLLLGGYRLWPAIFTGAFLVNITTQGSIATTFGVATGNTLEALLAAWLVNQFAGGAKAFNRPQTIFRFVGLAAMISPLVSAGFGVTSLCLGGYVPWPQYGQVWLTWWLGHAVGALIVTPLLVIWMSHPQPALRPGKILEAIALLLMVILVGQVIFLEKIPFAAMEQLGYLSILPILLAAFRFEARGAITAAVLMSGIALRGTVQGLGPFATTNQNQSLLFLQIFMGIVTFTALVLAAIVSERRKAEQQLRTLAHAVQGTAEMIYITNLENQITFVNRAFEQSYGCTEKEILGKTPDIIFSSSNPPGLKEKIREQSRHGSWVGEVLHKKKDGTEFPVFLSTSQVVSPDGSVHSLMGVARDISEYKRGQAGLQRLATIVADSEDAIISMTLDGAIVTWNKAAQRIYGYSAEEAIGRSTGIVFPPVSADKMSQILQNVAQGKKIASYETLCRRKNGSLFEISLTVSSVTDTAGKAMGASVIARDVSERRKLEREVLDISTHERRRIGYELHDGLSQHLAGIAFKAKSLQDSLADEEATHTGAAHEIVELVNDAMRQTRQVTRNLDPTEVEASGLVAALKRLCIETSAVFRMDCRFTCQESQLPLEAQTNLALFRIAQEAVRNALVHGGPERIELKLFLDDGWLNLLIQDDGKGFNPSKKHSGIGLRLMQYRARTIDAMFQLSSKPGAGTFVQCSLPFSFSARSISAANNLETSLAVAK